MNRTPGTRPGDPDLRVVGGDQPAAVETVHLVELSALTDLARLGLRMRKAQRAYFDARCTRPHSLAEAEFTAARAAEVMFDKAVAAALERERACLPGMEGGGS